MTFESKKLRDAPNGQSCVRCGKRENVVGCHYTGVRRLSYGGGYGQKVHDFLIADLCDECHRYMDQLSREKAKKWEHSEEFQHYILLTLERRFIAGVITVSRGGGNGLEARPVYLPPSGPAPTLDRPGHVPALHGAAPVRAVVSPGAPERDPETGSRSPSAVAATNHGEVP